MVDTLSPYRSPVRLVLHAAESTSPYSTQTLARARKKLMAEIALGGDELEIDEVVYTRNDAATLLDNISEEAWRVHCLLYTFPGLLDFLEKESFDDEELKKADAYLYDQRFVTVVSPYFAHAFNVVSGKLLREERHEELLQLLQYKGYVLPEHQHEAFQRLRNYLDELSYTLRNLSWEKFSEDESILHFLFDEAWQKSMNALPASFNTLRDEIVTHIIEIVLRFQRKATWYYLHQVLVNLRMLDTNDFNRHEIARIDEVIYENTQLESRRGRPRKDNEITSGRVAWWGIWLVLMFVRMATCNDTTSTPGYSTIDYSLKTSAATVVANTAEQNNEKRLLQKFDSLLSGKKFSVRPSKIETGDVAFPFSEPTDAAVNDSLQVVNNTGYDAVYFYFKDIPGHAMSGKLPKLYTAYIKKGDTAMVYVLPGNGRVYFAFGEGWGKLKKPFTLSLPGFVPGSATAGYDYFEVNQFFSSGIGKNQRYLLHPIHTEAQGTTHDLTTYHYLNTGLQKNAKLTTLYLSASPTGITIDAKGRLMVKEAAAQE